MRIFFGIIITLLAMNLAFAQQEEGFTYDAGEVRDPFVPLVSKAGGYISDVYGIKGIKDVRLEGIVWDEKGPVAIINGEIVKGGEEIGALKLLEIEKDAVIFYIDGQEVRVELVVE